MPLAGYKPETRVVALGGDNTMIVRGLSLSDVSVLVREHLPDLDAVFDLFQGIETMTPEQFRPLALSIASQAPGFAANVIALAAGEGSASDAERLPAPVQVQALLDIGELTFSEVGGVKKFGEMVASLLMKTDMKKKFTSRMSGR